MFRIHGLASPLAAEAAARWLSSHGHCPGHSAVPRTVASLTLEAWIFGRGRQILDA